MGNWIGFPDFLKENYDMSVEQYEALGRTDPLRMEIARAWDSHIAMYYVKLGR